MPSHDPLVIATDGSCLGNPGPGGWAWAVSADCWAAGGQGNETTNNLMEMRAVFEALSATPADRPLIIEADSEYVINVFSLWLPGWKKRGWRKSDKKPPENLEAIKLVDALLVDRDVQWRHVRGHAGHVLNELADRHAWEAATSAKNGKPVATGPMGCLDATVRTLT